MAEKIYSLYGDDMLDQRLAVEVGDKYVVLVAGADRKVVGLEYYTTEDDLDETLEHISSQSALMKKNYSETKVFYNVKESVLVPVGHFNTSAASDFIDVAYGESTASRVNVEHINIAPGIVNVYRSDENWTEIIGRHFRAVTKRHLYSRLVEQSMHDDDQVKLIFYQQSFTIIATGNRQLKLVRSFNFATEADVLYHVLNVCRHSGIDAAEASLTVCGTISKDGELFRMIRKYFGRITLDASAHDALPSSGNDQYPRHYFTSFINLLS